MLYVKIENPVKNPISSQFWTIWGTSTKRESKNYNKRIIGQFGSGGNHSIGLCLRQQINPIIFNEKEKLEFFTQPLKLNSLNGTETQLQVGVIHSGKDKDGKSIRKKDILNHTLSFGSMDWTDISFALREFISNAIDACYMQDLDHTNVSIEIVNENQVRAKDNTIRVFIPLTEEVQNFYNNIGSWFLHFSNPELLDKNIFEHRNKNLVQDNKGAMIYRRGVLVCEVNSKEECIYDYNVEEIEMNESRSVDSWNAMRKACSCIYDCESPKTIGKLLSTFAKDGKYWEHTFPSYYWSQPSETAKTVWINAWQNYFGDDSVIASELTAKLCENKGYKSVFVPENYYAFLKKTGITSDSDVLTSDEMSGKKMTDPSEDFVYTTKFVWEKLQQLNLTNNREMPDIKGFDVNQTDNTITFGFWKNDTVAYNNIMRNGRNEMLLHTVIEELTHHITKAMDGSRDFQNYLIKVIADTLFKDFISKEV